MTYILTTHTRTLFELFQFENSSLDFCSTWVIVLWSKMLHWQTAAYYQAGYKREYPYGYDYPGRSSQPPSFGSPVA